jgi:signal transduction histidine kinase
VEQTRRRNLGISGGLLLLLLGTVAALVRYSRQSQQLAETRMNFVAGVSHELRTPLTVIRTASFNLCGTLARNPHQVERYGKLIQSEAERLSSLVEQVLLFANEKSGSILRDVSPYPVAELIEESLRAARVRSRPGLVVDTRIPAGLPAVLADEVALAHALQNLIENAAKHGAIDLWIGISARSIEERGKTFVEISVMDHGPGIPAEEQAAIFEPFYRGHRAVQDQIRGTGLGLDLVKKIAEAHGGSILVHSKPLERTEFVLRIPAAPAADQPEESPVENEFAHPAD